MHKGLHITSAVTNPTTGADMLTTFVTIKKMLVSGKNDKNVFIQTDVHISETDFDNDCAGIYPAGVVDSLELTKTALEASTYGYDAAYDDLKAALEAQGHTVSVVTI